MPKYKTYCVKCGEFGHISISCDNIDDAKMHNISTNHQIKLLQNLYRIIPSLSNSINRKGEFICRTCNRSFREYKYYMYHEVYYSSVCKFSKIIHDPNIIILK
jgi:hypothetical protein